MTSWRPSGALYRYSGQEDFVVGSPIAGRDRAETEDLIGFFVNSLPLRANLAGNPRFRELLARVKETALGAYAHQDLPFERIVEELQPARSLSYPPIFQVMFALQNQPRSAFTLPGLSISAPAQRRDSSKFDLTLFMAENDGRLSCRLEYNTDLFDTDVATRLLQHFEVLLEGAVARPQQRVADLPLLGEAERHQLLTTWNATAAPVSAGPGLHHMVEQQAASTPDAAAVIFEGPRPLAELNGGDQTPRLRRDESAPKCFRDLMDRSSNASRAARRAESPGHGRSTKYPRERVRFSVPDARLA